MKKAIIIITGICSIIILQNCSNSKKAGKTPVVVSFEKDVMPIMQARCTPCHFPPEGRKKPLNNYETVKAGIADVIARVKLPQEANGFMPFKNKKPPLSDSLINVLVQWQQQGMPQ
ncbi:hypothetical protein [Ferruginibacter sp.]